MTYNKYFDNFYIQLFGGVCQLIQQISQIKYVYQKSQLIEYISVFQGQFTIIQKQAQQKAREAYTQIGSMGKKLLKIQMQKQKEPLKPKATRILRSNKTKRNPSHDQDLNAIESIVKKIQILEIDDLSETKDQSVEVKRCLKKSISKSKITKKSQQKKSIKKQIPLTSPQHQKLITTACTLHRIKSEDRRKQGKFEYKDLVSLEWFNKISATWGSSKDKKQQTNKPEIIKKTQKITYLSEITSTMLKRLKPKHWLNDEIVNSYIQLIQLDMINQSQINNTKGNIKHSPTIHLVQSYFATLKATPDKIQRQIKKRGFTSESTIIIPINAEYHWFFVIICHKQIFICDSILPKNISKNEALEGLKRTYSMKQTLKKCFQLYEMLYQVQQFSLDDLHVITGYPQQDNQNDCGMMMLCGMRDVVLNFQTLIKGKQKQSFTNILSTKDFWNFCQQDIKFLRFLFTRQLLEEKIIFC